MVVPVEEPRVYPVSTAVRQRYQIESRLRNVSEAIESVLDAAQLGPGMTVVDISAGTALVAPAARARVGARGRVLVLDRDGERLAMVQDAASRADIQCCLSDLGDWHDAVPGTVDRVVAAQALWWFHQADRVLAAVAAHLGPAGRFAFAIPGTYFDFGDGVQTPQWVFASILAECGQAVPPAPPTLTKAAVESRLAAAGLQVLRYRAREVEVVRTEWEPGGELHGLLQLHPPAWPGHDLAERIERALAQLRRWGPELRGRQALWRHAVFSCVPARRGRGGDSG